jgi:hypothetical protein
MSEYSHLTGEPPVTTPAPAPQAPKPRKRHRVRNTALILGGIGLATAIGVGIGSSGSTASPAPSHSPAASQWNADGSNKDAGKAVTSGGCEKGYEPACPTTDPGTNPFQDNDPTNDPNYQGGSSAVDVPQPKPPTVAQENALRSAQEYLDMGDGMSRLGLIDQLHSSYGEGFKLADARWAVNHVHANWNHQAALSAKGYLDMEGFSRAGLIDQLSSAYGEQFTLAQATYAVNQVGL